MTPTIRSPTRAEPPPEGGRFGAREIRYLEHLPRSLFTPFLRYKSKLIKAKCNFTMYSNNNIYDMCTNQVVTDPALNAFELQCAKAAVAEDAAAGAGQPCSNDCSGCTYCGFADQRFGNAIRVDFLVALCIVLNLWDWSTFEVVVFLVKACTEEWRCRFAMHPDVQAYTGPAVALMSHSWSNSFGDLIAGAAQGAPFNRYIWICALANRQWPGNAADIDFRSMVRRCKAVIVANPIPAGPISEKVLTDFDELEEYMASPPGKAALRRLTTSRIWCICRAVCRHAVQETVDFPLPPSRSQHHGNTLS